MDMNKEACSLVTAVSHLVNMQKAYLRMELTSEESESRESQRTGIIFLIIPCLKSALPMEFTKLSEPINCIYYLSQYVLGFTCT